MTKHQKYMELAKQIGELFSKDNSTKVGAIVVGEDGSILTTGYNGFVRGSDDSNPLWHERPMKYSVTSHAECNAIYNAARNGVKMIGSSMYISSLCPCNNCSMAIVQSGVKNVYLSEWAFSSDNPRGQAWINVWPLSKEILDIGEVNVEII